MVTIVAYGACYYAYGVLIQPIHTDTGGWLTTRPHPDTVNLVIGHGIAHTAMP